MITSEEIKRKLWDGANDLRGSMDASKYKDYMLGLMFYKFLSDKTLETFKETSGLGDVSEEELLNSYVEAYEAYGEKLESMIQKVLGYYVLPKHLYQTWLKDIKDGEFELQKVTDSLNDFERTIAVSGDSDDFKGLFSSSIIDMTNTALGNDLAKRSKNIKDLILLFADLNMVELQDGDVLGDAYEYLIGKFASDAGKKAGEFYTPHQVSEVMAQIVAKTTDVSSIYDPTVGSGSLLLTVSKHMKKEEKKDLNYYGQEYITETYNLTRMNLLLHGVRPEKMNIKNGNTLAYDWPEDPERPNEGVQFDAVVMNPPYSDKKWNKREEKPLKVSDPRFADFGVLPPDNKGDFAYLMHGLYHLDQKGTMAIVLPHGVLFRGGAEGEIRKRILNKNYVDAIIGLPSNLFTNTGIPVCVLILKKNRDLAAPLLIIDASNGFIKVGKQNVLQEKDIAKIVDTYVNKSEIVGYSHLASREEIQLNEYNMNIPRYVEAINDVIAQDVDAHLYGGIPSQNISELNVLNHVVPEIMESSFRTVRLGYVEMNKKFSALLKEVLSDDIVVGRMKKLKNQVIDYSNRWYQKLKMIDKFTELRLVEEEMLTEIKEMLSTYPYIDVYDGYQLIAKIWKEALTHDCEYIALNGFYDSARALEKNMVWKGQGEKRRREQDGFKGVIIPFELVQNKMFSKNIEDINLHQQEQDEIDNQLNDILETLSEDDGEFDVLDDKNEKFVETKVNGELKEALSSVATPEIESLNEYLLFLGNKPKKQEKIDFMTSHSDINWGAVDKNKDGTVSKGKVSLRIAELRNEFRFEEDSFESKLAKVQDLLQRGKELKTDVKEQLEVVKKMTEGAYATLSEEIIDELVYKKWFSSLSDVMSELVKKPLQRELSVIETLNTRYNETLFRIDDEIQILNKRLSALLNDLAVM